MKFDLDINIVWSRIISFKNWTRVLSKDSSLDESH